MKTVERVDENGDESGLRSAFALRATARQGRYCSPSSTNLVAVRVNRNGQENGGEDRYAANPLQRQALEKKEVCQL
jgi:hypothetical protein